MAAVDAVAPDLGATQACRALGISRATPDRRRRPPAPPASSSPRPRPPRALSEAERQAVRAGLHAPRFVDLAPAEVVATLLDEGTYLASERTTYRILADAGQTGERRNQLSQPRRARPELLATQPNELWSWDITKLLGPATWTYYYPYVVLDVFSRYVVGWTVAHAEQAALAERLPAETTAKQQILPGTLTVHADRGSSMTSKPVAFLLADLGVTKSHSRPHVSDDNRYSQAQFKTLKYRPGFPDRFGSVHDARALCQQFFGWYNREHRHSGIAMMTLRRSTTATPLSSTRPALRCWPPPTPPIPSASCAGRPHPNPCLPRCGSIRPSRHRRRLSKQLGLASQKC
jgi:putative transposase